MGVHEHPLNPPLSSNLLHSLKSTLPYSVNLVYRIQHPNKTQHAHVLATFSPEESPIPECWVAAYFDNSMRPETDLWIFAAGEVPGHRGSTSKGESEFCSLCKQLVLSLLDHISGLEVPPLRAENEFAIALAKRHEEQYPELGPNVKFAPSTGTYMRHLLLQKIVTLGAAHHQVVQICAEAGLVRDEFPSRDARLNKFFFRVADLTSVKELPVGLRWGEMRPQDIPAVQATTSIPRGTGTLLSLKSVGAFDADDIPVCWTFLGLDGSLTTLYTDPKYRGKGLAKNVASKIIRDYASQLAVDERGNAWAHADVYEGNVQSESVCKSLGGHAGAKIFWVRIDLTRAGALSNHQ
ncbi:unnamed protein product [Periconia digitata]|uniref:N-acetyltransferase domain-containing protein n=1 Tax=Periconia digitata TaxID=1303443 RepID=A0A9W4U9K2_9PLEO|nr:unnamed protein product [Periconia digitata]